MSLNVSSRQLDLSVSYNEIGGVQQAQGNLAAALTSYQASLAIAERLAADSPLEGSGFELPVPQCALSSPTARPWSRPPDLAVSGGALNGHLIPTSGSSQIW
jgi:hypothetical protein